MSRQEDVEQLRDVMGTSPQRSFVNVTGYVRGGESIDVRPISGFDENWYRGMFIMATSTWGGPYDSGMEKWNRATVDARMQVLLAIVQRKALPLALEHPQFLFEVSGCSRSAFDQIARARLGVTFSSMGVRDNSHADTDVIVPPKIHDDAESLARFQDGIEAMKNAYVGLLEQGQKSWQDARAVLPMGMMHRFCISINYASLSTLCGKRLQFCEQYDTVAVAWKLRQALTRRYALLGVALRPSCDFARRCTYHEANSLGEAFGALFRGCGRWEDPYPLYEFNESAAERSDVEQWLGETVPDGDLPIDFESALGRDHHWFEEEFA